MRVKRSFERFQSCCVFLCVAFNFYGYYRGFSAQHKIYLVITLAPIEYFETMRKCLTNDVSPYT